MQRPAPIDVDAGGATPALAVRGLDKRFGAVHALKSVSLDLRAGEIVALCGENGAGKSTLVKLLCGVLRPDGGEVLRAGRPLRLQSSRDAQREGIALVSQELSICPALSVLDNLWLGAEGVPWWHRRAGLRRRAAEVLALLGLDLSLDARAGDLRLGERQLLEIARGLARDAQVLILDEPTATLTDAEIERVFAALQALRRDGRTVVLVTHRLGEVFRLCDRVVVMRNGEKVADRPASGLDRDTLVQLLLGHALEPPAAAGTGPRPTTEAVPRLHARGLELPGVFGPLDLNLHPGEVLALVGQLGAGAGEVVRALAGLEPRARGTLSMDGQPLRLGSPREAWSRELMFVSGDRAGEGLFLDLPVQANLLATRLPRLMRQRLRLPLRLRQHLKAEAARLAGAVAADARRLSARAGQLSGGNQQKLAFGRCVERGAPGVLAMVEPTRGIDVGARAELHRLMRRLGDEGHSLVMACSDLEEVLAVADRVVTLYRGRLVGDYPRGQVDAARLLADITHPTP